MSDTPLEMVVVGRSAAHVLRSMQGCRLQAVYGDLDEAERAPREARRPASLFVRLASLQPADVVRLARLAASLGSTSVLVTYAYGTDASAEALRRTGATVSREPFGEREISEWMRRGRAPTVPAAVSAPWPAETIAVVSPRRFSDEALAQLAGMPSPVACQCLRHMAEIVAQLTGFERYSQDCLSSDPADFDLHRQLGRIAGTARTLFEGALQQVVSTARIELPPACGADRRPLSG